MKKLLTLIGLGASCWLAGCGQSDEPVAGIEGTGDKIDTVVASGTVTGFGSIYVNGVHFNTDAASFTLDGEAITEGALAVGMVVSVEGTIDESGTQGLAAAVHAERVAAGQVAAVSALADGRKVVTLLGQTIYVNEDAAFDGVDFDQLEAGQSLQISGFVAADGKITATHCKLAEQAISQVTLEGVVTVIAASRGEFAINGQMVNTAAATFKGGDFDALRIGTRVKIRGTLTNDGVIDAEQIQLRAHGASAATIRTLEGIIAVDAGRYEINGIALDVSAAAVVNGDLDALQGGSRALVFGAMQAGVFVAERMVIKPLNTSRLRGEITGLDADANSLQVHDTTVVITPFTQFIDGSAQMQRYFHFDDLRIGEDVDIFAVMVNGQWRATRVMRRDRDEERSNVVRGHVMLVADSATFYLDDIAVDGSQLSDQTWQLLRAAPSPVIVEVAGFFTASRQFTAVDIQLRVMAECDPHVFFACDDDEHEDREPQRGPSSER